MVVSGWVSVGGRVSVDEQVSLGGWVSVDGQVSLGGVGWWGIIHCTHRPTVYRMAVSHKFQVNAICGPVSRCFQNIKTGPLLACSGSCGCVCERCCVPPSRSVLSEIEHDWVPLINDGIRTLFQPEVEHKLARPYAN